MQDLVLAILSTSRALQFVMRQAKGQEAKNSGGMPAEATPSAPAGALLLGPPGSGRRTCLALEESVAIRIKLGRSPARCADGQPFGAR